MQTNILHRLEPLLARVPPERRLLAVQFLRFAIIGTLGFVWDTLVVYALRGVMGLYAAGMVSYVVAGSMNWLLNRIWTYRHLSHGAMHRQLVMFLLANSVGLVLNRGLFVVLVATEPLCRSYPVLPVAAGGLAGMFVNFFLSRRLVFR